MIEYKQLVVEGLLLTCGVDGSFNLSPMGVRFSTNDEMILLRPFKSSRSYRNLKQIPEAVFHVTDDVHLIARSALGDFTSLPPVTEIKDSSMCRLSDTCRWYLMRLAFSDESEARASFDMQIISGDRVRDFVGFNRAKFAVIEAAIYATRVGLLDGDEILEQFKQLEPLVEKTGGQQERNAFMFLKNRVQETLEPQVDQTNRFAEPSSGKQP